MMKLNKGSLEVGKDADLVIVDLDKKWTVDPKQFLSKSQNSPFIGRELDGKIVATIRKGKLYRWN
jgi:dihydroorotase